MNHLYQPSLVVHAYNPSTQETEAGGVQGQCGLHSETLPRPKKKKITCINQIMMPWFSRE
jgi:hypothetical protein